MDTHLPPDVFRTSVPHVRPKGVLLGFAGIKMAERIDKSFFKQLCETLSFFFGEACGLRVAFRVCQV